jgi:hypothetical protein
MHISFPEIVPEDKYALYEVKLLGNWAILVMQAQWNL